MPPYTDWFACFYSLITYLIINQLCKNQAAHFEKNKENENGQNPIQGFEMGAQQRKENENNHEQSQNMGLGISIEDFEMRAWQLNGQRTTHRQSTPVQIPQMVIQNPIQDDERV